MGVADDVIMTAERSEVVGVGAATSGPRFAVVDITVAGRHAAAGEHAHRVAGPHEPRLGCGWAPLGRSRGDDETGIAVPNHELPGHVALLLDNLARNIGGDGPEAFQLTGLVLEAGECRQVGG